MSPPSPPDAVARLEPAFEPGPARRIGLVSLSSDETGPNEIRAVLAQPGLAIHESRIANADRIDRASLAAMEAGLTRAAARLPLGAPYAAVAFLCTSASMLFGSDRVAGLIRAACPGAAVTNPMAAAVAAVRALGLGRIALVTPYDDPLTRGIADAFRADGVEVLRSASFFVDSDARVARISAEALERAVSGVVAGAADGAEAVFVSCTALATVHRLDRLEAAAGRPVLTSNQAVAWQLARLAGLAPAPGRWGALFERAPPTAASAGDGEAG